MVKKLGRKKDHRELMMRNLLTSLVLYEKINTTKAKAKELSSYFDRMITEAKKNDLVAKKRLNSLLFDSKSVAKVFEVLVPRYKNRISGYTSLAIISNRKGDNSSICRLELLDKQNISTELAKETKKDVVKTKVK